MCSLLLASNSSNQNMDLVNIYLKVPFKIVADNIIQKKKKKKGLTFCVNCLPRMSQKNYNACCCCDWCFKVLKVNCACLNQTTFFHSLVQAHIVHICLKDTTHKIMLKSPFELDTMHEIMQSPFELDTMHTIMWQSPFELDTTHKIMSQSPFELDMAQT